MSKFNVGEFYLDVYKVYIYVYYGTIKRINTHRRSMGVYDDINNACTANFVGFEDRNLFFFIRSDAEITPGMIAHEAQHCVNFICDVIGQKQVKVDDDEWATYLLEYIVDKVWDYLPFRLEYMNRTK